jgi:hypothetical protein
MPTEDVLTLAIAGGGTATGLVTLARGLAEYRLQGRQKRADRFFALRESLKNDRGFSELAELLDEGASPDRKLAAEADRKLEAIPFRIKRNYLGLFEEVALALNSGLIRPEVAHYMFGYYAILCEESDSFWNNVGRASAYWSLFRVFYARMKVHQADLLSGSLQAEDLRF